MSAANGRNRISAKEFVAATAVILSLVFVGLEIRQNTLAVRSSTLQALSDSHRDLVLGSILSQEHSALISRTSWAKPPRASPIMRTPNYRATTSYTSRTCITLTCSERRV